MRELRNRRARRGLRRWIGKVRVVARRGWDLVLALRRRRTGVAAPSQAEEPSLGDVSVTELFTVLVDQHDFQVRPAVTAIALGLAEAGYPPDHDRVSAADAFAIIEYALRETERPRG